MAHPLLLSDGICGQILLGEFEGGFHLLGDAVDEERLEFVGEGADDGGGVKAVDVGAVAIDFADTAGAVGADVDGDGALRSGLAGFGITVRGDVADQPGLIAGVGAEEIGIRHGLQHG